MQAVMEHGIYHLTIPFPDLTDPDDYRHTGQEFN